METPVTFGHEASIRLVLAPERDEQVLNPVEFERASFRTLVNEVGHGGERPLLSYNFGKSYEITVDAFTLVQTPEQRGAGPLSSVSVRLGENGAIVLDMSVTRAATGTSAQSFHSGTTVFQQDIGSALLAAFAFCLAFFDRIDGFGRHQRFNYNVVLQRLGHRTITRDATPRESYGMRMRDDLTVFSPSRVVSRVGLGSPDTEVEAVLVMIRRQLASLPP